MPPPSIGGLSANELTVGVDNLISVSVSSSGENTEINSRLVTVPDGSTLQDTQYSGAEFTIRLDVAGSFQLQVDASDSTGSSSQTFDLQAINNAPVAEIQAPERANLLSGFSLSGVQSFDKDGHALSYQWQLLDKPELSNLERDLGAEATQLIYPDAKGEYRVRLIVTDGFGGESESEHLFSTSAFKFRRFVFNVIDAVFSESLDAVVAVGDDNKLYRYSMDDHSTRAVSLSFPGTAVSVLPDGTKAAVGHDGRVSIVDLANMQVEKVWPISADVFDLEIAENGFVYVMPREDQWEALRALKIDTGEEFQQSGYSVRAGTVIKMHPSQDYIYGADRGLSPSDIEKYDIRSGAPIYMYDSPYHGDYGMCGDLWMSRDGLRIFTRCGNVFRASETREQDMIYNGRVDVMQRIAALSHHDDEVAFLDEIDLQQLNYYGYQILASAGEDRLPVELAAGQAFATEGQFVFHRENGEVIALVQVEAASGYLRDWGVAYVPTEIETFNLPPVAIAQENTFTNIHQEVSVSAEQSLDPEGADLSFQWELASRPVGSSTELQMSDQVFAAFVPDMKGEYVLRVKVSDGIQESEFSTVTVTAEDPADKLLIELDFEVLASAYSQSLEKLVLSVSSPARLVLFDIETQQTEEIALQNSAPVMTLSLDGKEVALANSTSVTIVDLMSKAITGEFSIDSSASDLALPGNGFVYVFPLTNQWRNILSIEIATGVQTFNEGRSIYAGTMVDLHPSGNFIYGADNGLSPSDIELYDVSGGTASYVKDSPYHGDYAMCGNVWVASDGASLFTPCGNVFRANPGEADDMQYRGALNLNNARIRALSHFGEEIALITQPRSAYDDNPELGHVINLYNSTNFGFDRAVEIPESRVGDISYRNYGQELFHSADGSTLISVVKVDSEAGKLYEHSLFVFHR